MSLTVPDLDTVTDRVLEDYRGRFPSDDVSPYSDNYKRVRARAMAVWMLLHGIKTVEEALLPDKANGTDLDRIGAIYGVTRKAATPARKSDALRLTGTLASTFSIGDELTDAAGLVYQVNEAGSIPAGLFVDVDVVGVSTGAATKLAKGTVLTFTSPPSGINAEAELQLAMDEDGEDAESDGAYRVRILDKIAQPGMGGNANDYKTWALAETGIAAAYPYPLRRGLGSVDVAALHAGSGSVRLLTAQERTDLEAALDLVRPAGMLSFRIIEVTTKNQNVDLQVKELPGYTWDWDDTGGPLTVSSWTAATRVLQFTTSRPSDMAAGDRIVIKTAAGDGSGAPIEIESLGPGADEVVIVEKDVPAVAPVNTDSVYAGGDLTTPIRDSVKTFLDTLGPAVGSYGTGEWISDVEPEHLLGLALRETGVRNGQVNTPSATVTADDPVFPLDTTIELIIPVEVVVRRLP